MGEHLGETVSDRPPAPVETFRRSQRSILHLDPAHQVLVDAGQERIHLATVERSVVLHPTTHDRVDHARDLSEGQVGAQVQTPSPDLRQPTGQLPIFVDDDRTALRRRAGPSRTRNRPTVRKGRRASVGAERLVVPDCRATQRSPPCLVVRLQHLGVNRRRARLPDPHADAADDVPVTEQPHHHRARRPALADR